MFIEWAGFRFEAIGHHDGHFLLVPGVYAFVRRETVGHRTLLFVDHCDHIALAACPGHAHWDEALRLGMNELNVCLVAKERIDRLLVRAQVIRRCGPLLNILNEEQRQAKSEAGHLNGAKIC